MRIGKRKLLGIAFIAMTLAAGAVDARKAQNHAPMDYPGARGVPFRSLQYQIYSLQAELKTGIEDIKAQMAALEVADYEEEIEALQAQSALLQSDLDSIQATLDGKQDRVSESCPDGWSIRAIDTDGDVICERDDVGSASGSMSAMRRSVATTVSPHTTGLVTASCPSGFQAIGGGYSAASAIAVFSSEPLSTRSWNVRGTNNSSFFLSLTATVICTEEG